MNCFVMMPFAPDFEDVYAVIKSTVEATTVNVKGRCFRLDESRPAGRITERLVSELRSATMCIADLTGLRPNVKWELGFAMALGKPTIVVTQDGGALPFNIEDMQSVQYDRKHLNSTLAARLRQSVLDTLGASSTKTSAPSMVDVSVSNSLLVEVSQLKLMVADAVSALKANGPTTQSPLRELQPLVGHWLNTESGSHYYSQIVRGELVSPYCYAGNEHLTGVYFGWRRMGAYWFARYRWIEHDLSGFAFLRMDSLETLSGAWWSAEDERHSSHVPPKSAGIAANWIKQADAAPPAWANKFFARVEQEGLASFLAECRA
jgi:nucleoside 2-deoxyribosyltransferase